MTEQPKPANKTLIEIMARPLPPVTPEREQEMDELEELVSRPPIQNPNHKTLTEIMDQPLPEITPEKEAELAELEEFFDRLSDRQQ